MMKLNLSKTHMWLVLRIGLGLLFVYASLYKIISPTAFARQIFNYQILPVWGINPVANVLPWIQFLCGIALLSNRWVKGASFLLFGMMIVFQGGVASALIRGLSISCGCFSSGGDPATWITFGRDFLILVAVLLYFCRAQSIFWCKNASH